MKILTLFFPLAVILCSIPLSAQTPFTVRGSTARTIGISDDALIDQMMMVVDEADSRSRDRQQQQSLKSFLMPVRKLGFRGADWSYTLATCLEYYVNLQRNFKDNLSPDFISLGLKSEGQGTSIPQGLAFLTREGTVSAAIMPYDADQVPTAVYATTKYRINNYLHLFQAQASAREKTFEMRKALIRGNPVIVEFQADDNFAQLAAVRNWEGNQAAANRSYPLLVVGFDESKQAFEVRGSWGASWADNGYLWIGYDDFGRAAQNGYVMVPEG